jgi:hypothetical protein
MSKLMKKQKLIVFLSIALVACATDYHTNFLSLKNTLIENGYCREDFSVSLNRMDCLKEKITIVGDSEAAISIYGITDEALSKKLCEQFFKEIESKGARTGGCGMDSHTIDKKSKNPQGMVFTTGDGL